jgi:hypothetical protein
LGSGIRDPGSGKNLFRIPYPGVKKHPIPDPGSGSATLLLFSFSVPIRVTVLLIWKYVPGCGGGEPQVPEL